MSFQSNATVGDKIEHSPTGRYLGIVTASGGVIVRYIDADGNEGIASRYEIRKVKVRP